MQYLNEHDPFAASWLERLSELGHIPVSTVDRRDIQQVQGADLDGYDQCHFFAGLGGWCEALRLAGWPADAPVWTGSCPCQPFSVAGKGKGEADERHLWPEFRRLIAKCKPPVVIGEQVASAAGRQWLAGVRADLEALGYVVGAADLCAAGAGAPHIRQRLFWVAYSGSSPSRNAERRQGTGESAESCERRAEEEQANLDDVAAIRLGESFQSRLEGLAGDGDDGSEPGRLGADAAGSTPTASGGLVDAASDGREQWRAEPSWRLTVSGCGGLAISGFWSRYAVVHCRDGKARRVEPGIQPLAHGVQNRVGLLRGAGNAIVPQIAAVFIEACMDSLQLLR